MDTLQLIITKPYLMEIDINSINVVSNNRGRGSASLFDILITIDFNSVLNAQFMSFIHQNIGHNRFDMCRNDTKFLGCLVSSIEYSENGNISVCIRPDYHIISDEYPSEIIALKREKTINQLFDID